MVRINRPGARPSPVRGEAAQESRVPVEAKQLGALEQLKHVDGAAVDKYLESAQEMLSRGILRGPMQGADAPILAPPPGSGAVSPGSAKVQQLLDGVLEGMGKIATDGFVSEGEINALGAVQDKLGAALELQSSQLLLMLPDDVVKSLEANLFGPMSTLLDGAHQQQSALFADITDRDQAALKQRLGGLDAPGGKKRLTQDGVLNLGLFRQLDAPDLGPPEQRAEIGDLVAIGRSGGRGDMGVIVGKDDDGVSVEVLTGDGQLGMKRMNYDEYAQRNPIKLGATFNHEGKEFYVHGLDDEGRVRARGFDARGRAAEELDATALAQLAGVLGKQTAAETLPSKSVVAAGGAEVIQPATVKGKTAEGGLFTSRGPNEAEHGVSYKDYNEDAAVLGVVPGKRGKAETFYAGAFDQAGGMGHSSATGAASQAAAQAFERAAVRVGQGGDVKQELLQGHQEAIDEVAKLNEGMGTPMMTTVASGIIQGGKAHVIACGDAQAMLFSKDGTLKAHTTPHNYHEEMYQQTGDVNAGLRWANGITRSVGGDDPAFQKPDLYEWDVKPGDYLLFLSDGVTDANLQAQKDAARTDHPFTRMNGELTEEQLGEVLRGSKGAEDATANVAKFALDHVVSGAGKPDNTTAVVVQVR
jgi:serine/threonine protein phosphatase PrpC